MYIVFEGAIGEGKPRLPVFWQRSWVRILEINWRRFNDGAGKVKWEGCYSLVTCVTCSPAGTHWRAPKLASLTGLYFPLI